MIIIILKGSTTFHKTSREENMSIQFGYVPQKIFNHTRGQVTGSMNAGTINLNKEVNNKRRLDQN